MAETIKTFIDKPTLKNMGVKDANIEKYYDELVSQMEKAKINTKQRATAFLAQILHESGNLGFTKENLNYTAPQLLKTWPSRFKTLDDAKKFEKQPEKIANHVYGGRMGNTAPNDGYKYLGRGLIGVTGKENYSILAKDTGVDFVNKPELLEQPKYAVQGAVHFWNKYNLNEKADKGDFKAITQRINGGQIGAADRESKYQKLLSQAKEFVVENKKTVIGIGFFFWITVAIVGFIIYKNRKK